MKSLTLSGSMEREVLLELGGLVAVDGRGEIHEPLGVVHGLIDPAGHIALGVEQERRRVAVLVVGDAVDVIDKAVAVGVLDRRRSRSG